MRKALLGAVTAAIILALGGTSAFAAGPGCGRYFADADGAGVCDNAGGGCVYVDADGDGICDNCGACHWRSMTGADHGCNFVDEDGNGICDHYSSGQGRGCGYGRGARGGCGNGFRSGYGK